VQGIFNARYLVQVDALINKTHSGTFSLAQAIRLHGGYQRAKSRWESYVSELKGQEDPYGRGGARIRNKDAVHAASACSIMDAQRKVLEYEALVGALSAVIGQANNAQIEMEVDPELLK
jgi:hypothetical protein